MQLSDKIREVEFDRTRGASQLARKALDALKFFAYNSENKTSEEFIRDVKKLGKKLLETKPNMAPIQNLVAQIVYEIDALEEYDLAFVRKFAISRINELRQQSKDAVKKTAEWGATIISSSDQLATCSYSSTVYETLKVAKKQGKIFTVFVAESKTENNSLQHGQTMATSLKSIKITAEVFPDNEIRRYIPKAKYVLVGADSLLYDGSIINGTPTLKVTLKAKEIGIPVYSVCETAKVNTLNYLGKKIDLEKGFELVPSNLISRIITERGILDPNKIAEIAKEKSKFFERTGYVSSPH
jgi:translation initiation factor 2B subunit (eIF-2B alpha/beta/delta family)